MAPFGSALAGTTSVARSGFATIVAQPEVR